MCIVDLNRQGSSFWIGAKMIDNSVNHADGFYWYDGNDFTVKPELKVSDNFQSYSDGEPNNWVGEGDQDCLHGPLYQMKRTLFLSTFQRTCGLSYVSK